MPTKSINKTAYVSILFGLLLHTPVGALAAENAPGVKCLKPGIVTAAGQSSDIAVVKALLNTRLKLDMQINPTAKPEDLASAKTLIMVIGASTKGMGAAGIDLDKELARARELVKAAKEKNVKVIALHVGGESRRGKTTDDLLEVVVPESSQVIVVASGNKDKKFNALAAKDNVPLTEVANLAASGDAVKALFAE